MRFFCLTFCGQLSFTEHIHWRHFYTGDARDITPLLVLLQWRYRYSWYVNGTGNFVIAGGIGSVLA